MRNRTDSTASKQHYLVIGEPGGDYFVLPWSMVEQHRATAEQKARMDALVERGEENDVVGYLRPAPPPPPLRLRGGTISQSQYVAATLMKGNLGL